MIENRIDGLVKLGNSLQDKDNIDFIQVKLKAERLNKWFTQDFLNFAIKSISENFLNKKKIETWLSKYDISSIHKEQTVGLILAGNLPLVGFQDILTCFILGINLKVKMSSKDETLTKYVLNKLRQIDENWKCEVVERLSGFDKVIATGSNNTNRYFEYYFKDVPSLLRTNRNSIAILTGKETKEELEYLADDIFMFFGQGCRNISKLFIPKNYDIVKLFPHFDKYKHLHFHKLYMDNYDYTRTLFLMNGTQHYANEFIMLKEDENLQSRLATLNYSFYSDELEIINFLKENEKDIQCIISNESKSWTSFKFGDAQKPELWDYADDIDTVEFLLK